MLFNSIDFLIFFVIFFPLYLILKHQWQNRLLIFASCLFYASWSWQFLILMCCSISVDYFCSKLIHNSSSEKTRKLLLVLSISVNLFILFFFKYCNFFIASAQQFLQMFNIGGDYTIGFLNVVLPLGISFYTFEAISYVVDVYRKNTEPAKNYWDYFLFVIYFPHLVAGPIMRAKSFLPQVVNVRRCSWAMFYEGADLFFWGLFEKIFIADNLAKIVNPIFKEYQSANGFEILIALYAFTFQIFCDFDGYSNMARGLGKMMGFDLSINFKLPYFASNPQEFWQRWHITLSSWLRDYIYIPLGGNRHGDQRTLFNLLLTMFLGGLWHGASWHFVCWGIYHGLLLIGYRIAESNKQISSLKLKHYVKVIVFFHFTVLGWLLFRGQSMSEIMMMLKKIFMQFNVQEGNMMLLLKTGLIIMPLLIVQFFQYKKDDLMVVFKSRNYIKFTAYAIMLCLMIMFGVAKAEQFIYFQF